MNMYLELSRPLGDLTRWEKVFKRLTLLNKYYPMKVDYNCNVINFQRQMGPEKEESIWPSIIGLAIVIGLLYWLG